MALPFNEFEDIALPPVYERSMIISQPHSNQITQSISLFNNSRISTTTDNNEDENSNMPISMGWISISRGFQTFPISPEYFLSNVEQMEIQPVIDGGSNSSRQYRVRSRDQLKTLFLATENSAEWQKNILGSIRRLDIVLRDASGAIAFTLRKGVSFGCIPGFLHKMTVETPTQLIGNIQQNFTCFGVNFSIKDTVVERNDIAASISGPNMYFCCCTLENANFQIMSPDGSRQMASIIYQWDHLLLDYILLITFPINMDVKLKTLILGATFLLESLYFTR